MTGSTNQDKPFTPGETIEFCDDQYVVISNHGRSGTVREVGKGGKQISPFYWTFEGTDCRRVESIAA